MGKGGVEKRDRETKHSKAGRREVGVKVARGNAEGPQEGQGRPAESLRVNRRSHSSQGPCWAFPFSTPVGLWVLVIVADQDSKGLGKTFSLMFNLLSICCVPSTCTTHFMLATPLNPTGGQRRLLMTVKACVSGRAPVPDDLDFYNKYQEL